MSFSVFPLAERGAREASTIKMKQARAQCHKTFTGVISNAKQKAAGIASRYLRLVYARTWPILL